MEHQHINTSELPKCANVFENILAEEFVKFGAQLLYSYKWLYSFSDLNDFFTYEYELSLKYVVAICGTEFLMNGKILCYPKLQKNYVACHWNWFVICQFRKISHKLSMSVLQVWKSSFKNVNHFPYRGNKPIIFLANANIIYISNIFAYFFTYQSVLSRGMKPKKKHEVDQLSGLVMNILNAIPHPELLTIVDIGSGEVLQHLC